MAGRSGEALRRQVALSTLRSGWSACRSSGYAGDTVQEDEIAPFATAVITAMVFIGKSFTKVKLTKSSSGPIDDCRLRSVLCFSVAWRRVMDVQDWRRRREELLDQLFMLESGKITHWDDESRGQLDRNTTQESIARVKQRLDELDAKFGDASRE